MKRKKGHIFKYLKPATGAIALLVVLLLIQALCQLALPAYTSDIVNVGIQQGGIEDAVPETIRQATMDKLQLLMTQEQTALVDQYYVETDGGLFTLTDIAEDARAQLNAMLGPRLMAVAAIDGGSAMAAALLAQIPEGVDVWDALGALPDSQRAALAQQMEQMLSQVPESIVRQSAIAFLQTEYRASGVDVDAMQMSYLWSSGLWMIGLVLLSVLAAVTVVYLSAKVASGFAKRLREAVFKKVLSFGSMEFDTFSTASLITRSTNDIQQVQMMMSMVFRILFFAPVMGIGGIFMALRTNTSMAWTIGLGVGAVMTVVLTLMWVALPRFKRMQKLIDRLNLVTREILTGIPVIRAFCTQKHESARFDRANVDLMKVNLFVNRVMVLMFPLMMLIMNALMVLILLTGAHGVNLGQLQVGDLMAFMQYAMQIIMSFLMLSMMSIILPRASVSIGRINEVLGTESSIVDPEAPEEPEPLMRGEVRFDGVGFRYPGAEENVLTDISFTAKRGLTTAIIGSTGSGKSTLINLIPRFFDVSEGAVYVGGVNVKNMRQGDLRDRIGYVPQRGVLFSGTIDSNLRLGKQDATADELELAVSIAQASDFIQEKQEGMDAPISQGGTNVSGGQKQRLSIARAIVKNPDIYIFDDSFSALDYRTDVALRRALKAHTQDSTVIIVAQRVNTILFADQIVVLEEGRVAGIGTHEQLLKTCPVYEQIASSQLSPEEIDRSKSISEDEHHGQ